MKGISMKRPSHEITFSITIIKSTASNQEYKLTLIFQGIAKKKNPITTLMLQEIPMLQKFNDHSYPEGAYRHCL